MLACLEPGLRPTASALGVVERCVPALNGSAILTPESLDELANDSSGRVCSGGLAAGRCLDIRVLQNSTVRNEVFVKEATRHGVLACANMFGWIVWS